MTQSKLAGLLKLITIGLGFIGACVYFLILPGIGQDWAAEEGYGGYFWPWLLFLWGTGIPCYAALFEFWGSVQKSDGTIPSVKKTPSG